MRHENVMLTRFAYLVFPKLPSRFSHGVMDPQLEHRLLDSKTGAVLLDNERQARAAGRLTAEALLVAVAANGVILYEADRPFTIDPGRRYIAEFEFFPPTLAGVLQINGKTLNREYALPDYGEARSFGAGGLHSNLLSLWTSAKEPERVRIRIVPSLPPDAGTVGASIKLWEYEPVSLPFQVVSWVPYRIRVRSTGQGWLETPRMFQRGYVASVNGAPAPVKKTPEGLVAVQVPRGTSLVEVRWQAPPGLLALFWLSFLSMTAWLGLSARRALLPSSPAATGNPAT